MHRKIHSPTLAVGPTTLDALMDTSVGPSTLMAVADLMTPKRKRSAGKKTAGKKTAGKKPKRKACKAGKIRDRVTKRCRAPKK